MKRLESKRFNPDMLVVARKSRGLTQKNIADFLLMKQSHISKIEAGMLNPPDEMILKLPSILKYKTEFFFRNDEVFGIQSAIIYHRMRQSVSIKLLDKIEAQINIYRMNIQRLMRSVDVGECKIKEYDVDQYGSPENIADVIRAHWLLPSGPIKNLTGIIEASGGIVIPYDFGTKKIDGISQWVPSLPPMFFINKNIPGDRWRFSLAHELGHIVMHRIPKPDMEKEAQRFAAQLLIPDRQIAPSLQFITIEKLLDLKLYWKVSMQALLYKAQTLDLIKDRQRYYWAEISKAGYKTKEPVDIPREEPTLLSQMVSLHLSDLKYTMDDVCNMLSIADENDFQQLFNRKQRHLRLVPNPRLN